MTEELKCDCGCRRLLRTEVLSAVDGNPTGAEDVFQCPACQRAWKIVEDGSGVKLQLCVAHSAIVAWRGL